MQELSQSDIAKLNDFKQYQKFVPTWAYSHLMRLPNDFICLFSGNQYGKTASVAYMHVNVILGNHPIPKRNVLYFECPRRTIDELAPHGYYTLKNRETGARYQGWEKGTWTIASRPPDNKCPYCNEHIRIHERNSHIIRFCSETLPNEASHGGKESQGESSEVKNVIYPAFKKWLPQHLIKRDITARKLSMVLHDFNAGSVFGDLEYEGHDIVVEFTSYSQRIQAAAGVQRISVWCDEEPPQDFWDEQIPRILAEDGVIVLTLTPANRMSWTFDDLFEKAKIYIRTKTICDYLSDKDKKYQPFELTDSKNDIAVIQAASDDNPTLPAQAIEQRYSEYDDPDVVATRRYGVFKQSTGRIFKNFAAKVHMIDGNKYFPDGRVFDDANWVHARAEDYHEKVNLAIIWIALSPHNEAFVYREWNPSPEKWINSEVCQEIGLRSMMTKFTMNLIDPLANKIQTNTGISTIEDYNRVFYQLRKDGLCTGGLWEPWDTKGLKGRDEIRKRLYNSILVGRPFANTIVKDGRKVQVPTLWIFNSCQQVIRSIKQWRYEEWATGRQNTNKEQKETPSQKFSHFCTALEAVFKDNRFRPKVSRNNYQKERHYQYFQGAR